MAPSDLTGHEECFFNNNKHWILRQKINGKLHLYKKGNHKQKRKKEDNFDIDHSIRRERHRKWKALEVYFFRK